VGILWLLIVAVALWLVFRFVRSSFQPQRPTEEFEDTVEDPTSDVPAPKNRGPRTRSGAVALAEPEDQNEDRTYPPRVG